MENERGYRAWVLYLAAVAVFTAAIWWLAFAAALGQARERALSDLQLAADRLTGQLKQFSELAVLMADHPQVRAAAATGRPGTSGPLLRAVADKSGARALRLWTAGGEVLAGPATLPGEAFERAMDGALGSGLGIDNGQRVWRTAAPIFAPPRVIGAVEAVVDLGVVEAEWHGNPEAVWFTDGLGVAVVSNRAELLFRTASDPSPAARAFWGDKRLRALPPIRPRTISGHEIWRMDGGPYLPAVRCTCRCPCR